MTSTPSATDASDRGGPSLKREEAAHYIAGLAAELAALARQADLTLLCYFLEMARQEAQEIVVSERKARRKGDATR
jgi:hypothetical protein